MAYLNRLTLIGRVGKEPEERVSPRTGMVRVSFPLATTQRYRGSDGEMKEQTDWHNLVVWGKQAELAKRFVRKGSQIYVEGPIRYRSWDKEDGTKAYMTEVNVDGFQLLDPKQGGEGRAAGPYAEQRRAYAEQKQEQEQRRFAEDEGDDLPF